MSDDKEMRKRWGEFMMGQHPQRDLAATVTEFTQEAVRRALAPRSPSPELAEAEAWLRSIVAHEHDRDGGPSCPTSAYAWKFSKFIADELDRLRSEVARLRNSQQVSVDLLADLEDHLQGKTTNSASELLARLMAFWDTNGEVKSAPAPAQDQATRVVWMSHESPSWVIDTALRLFSWTAEKSEGHGERYVITAERGKEPGA